MKRTKARPAAIISIVVVVIAAVLAVFYFCFTREFLQTFMSDKTYAEYTIAKNSKEYVPKVTSALKKETSKKYAFSTDLDYKYDQGTSFDSVFTNSIVKDAVSTYIKTLSLSDTTYVNGLSTYSVISASDKDGAVLTLDAVNKGTAIFGQIPQLSSGWMILKDGSSVSSDATAVISGNTGEQTTASSGSTTSASENETEQSVKSALKDIFSKIGPAVSKDATVKTGYNSASGDSIVLKMTGKQLTDFSKEFLESAKTDDKLYKDAKTIYENAVKSNPDIAVSGGFTKSAYKQMCTRAEKYISDTVSEKKITELTVTFTVDTKNVINGCCISVTADGNSSVFKLALSGDEYEKLGISILKTDSHKELYAVKKAENTYGIKYYSSSTAGGVSSALKLSADINVSEKRNDATYTLDYSGSYGTFSATGTTQNAAYKNFTVPDKPSKHFNDTDVKNALKTSMMSYFLTTLPNEHSAFKTVYQNIVYQMFEQKLKSIGSIDDILKMFGMDS
jgi:hypothetical protein